MPRLSDIQRDFARALRSSASAPVTRNLDITPGALTPARRIAVYRNHHRISLATALAANFPTATRVIGAEPFQALATRFSTKCSPRDPRMENYGEEFPAFLDGEKRLSALPYIADVGRLDWALNRAERAEDAPIFGPQHLEVFLEAGLGELKLKAHPSASLLSSPYPLLRIRELANAPDDSTDGVTLDEGGVELAIWRRDAGISIVELDHATFLFLKSLAGGRTLGEAIGNLEADVLPTVFTEYVITGFFAMPA
ncbi:MAG TPA: DNA-binding domain-containing protein [Dongiaceae bacterium]